MPLQTEDKTRAFELAGHRVTVSSQRGNQALSDTAWLAFRAQDFATAEAASAFEKALRETLEAAGVCCFLGLHVDGVHPSGAGASLFDAQLFFNVLSEMGKHPPHLDELEEGFQLLNLALLNLEPLARAVLAISAVEALGQNEKWSENQKGILENVACLTDRMGSEGKEISDSIRNTLHRISLRQGVKRILQKHGIEHFFERWDAIQKKRGGIFHGTDRLSDGEVIRFSSDAVQLCVSIFLAIASRRGVQLPEIPNPPYT